LRAYLLLTLEVIIKSAYARLHLSEVLKVEPLWQCRESDVAHNILGEELVDEVVLRGRGSG
jgi:hypothetical protein